MYVNDTYQLLQDVKQGGRRWVCGLCVYEVSTTVDDGLPFSNCV